jgi:GR25 family glycosyltransferase involved in LPS biosynthesis
MKNVNGYSRTMKIHKYHAYYLILLGTVLVFILIHLQNKNEEGFQTNGYALPTEMLLINMDSRKDRLANFTASYNASDCKDKLPMHRISAVVGKEVDWKNGLLTPAATKDLEEVVKTGKRKGHESLTVGAVGCYLSHLKALEYVVEKNQPMIICEDDSVLPANFYEKMKAGILLPTPGQSILLLFHVICNGWEKLKCTLKKNNFYEVQHFWSMACYYITPETAKIILANARPLEYQIDEIVSRLTEANKIKIYANPIVSIGNNLGTDIQMPISRT